MKFKNIYTLFALLIITSALQAQIPERNQIQTLGISEISTWMKNLKFKKNADSVHFETRQYDTFGNEVYYYKNLRHFGWDQVYEYYRTYQDTQLVKEISYINQELKRIDTFTYNPHGDLVWQKSWSYPDPDTIFTLNTYFYNRLHLPDSVYTLRTGNFGMDTVRFFSIYAYDSAGREVWVKTKSPEGVLLSDFRSVYDPKGHLIESSEEYFGKNYFFDKEYFEYYANGFLASKTDANNNRYEFYYDHLGNTYYMLYVDRSAEPAAGYYYFHQYRPREKEDKP